MRINITHDLTLKAGTYESADARVKIDAGAGSDSELTLDFAVATDPPVIDLPVDDPAPIDPPVIEPPPPEDPPPVDPPSVVDPLPPVDPPAVPVDGQAVTLHGTLADGAAFDVVAKPGQRVALLPADKLRGGSLVYHADGLSVCIENAYVGLTSDLSGHFTLTAADGTMLFDGDLTIWAYTRTRPFWLKTPQIVANPDLSLFQTYGKDSGKESMAAAYAKADNGPMGHGLFTAAMDMVGERADLGAPLPQWDACYIVNPTAANAAVVRGMSDAAASWAYHAIDPATDKMIDMSRNRWVTRLGPFLGTNAPPTFKGDPPNPFAKVTTAVPHKVGQSASHAAAYCALASALYGTEYDREELAQWANYAGCLWQNPAYRRPSGTVSMRNGQVRGKGRRLYVLVCAAKLSSEPAYFDAWVRDQAASLYEDLIDRQAGIAIDQTGETYPDPKGGWAPWMQHIFVHGIGFALHTGYTEFQRGLDYFAEPIFDSILTSPHEFATVYTMAGQEADGSQVADWARGLARLGELIPKTAAALQCAEDSQELQTAMGNTTGYRPGDFSGYPWAPDGYPAMLQPALAVLARYATDQPRAQAAWAKFQQYARCDYSTNPKYNVVP